MPSPLLKFRVYYSDGEYPDLASDPSEALLEETPQWDVIAVVSESKSMGRQVLQSWDFYLYANGEWYGVTGMVDYVEHTMTQPIERILKGRRIPTLLYQEIMKRARKDPSFPKKSSNNPIIEIGQP